ncbi:MAG: TolC family protein [Myxococcota bacterium]|nr:TolC family protein [Myxococcota bacterium]
MLLLLVSLSAAGPLGYEEALTTALENNPTLGQSLADLEAAEAAVLGTRGVYDPQLTMSAGRNWELSQGFTSLPVGNEVFLVPYDTSDTSWTWSAGVSQTLATGTSWGLDWSNYSNTTLTSYTVEDMDPVELQTLTGSTRLTASLTQQLLEGHSMAYNLQATRSAQASRDQAAAQLQQQRQETLKAVALAYWELVYASQARLTADKAVVVAMEEERIVAAQLEAGTIAPVDLTRVQAALAQARLNAIQAEATHQAASDALAVLLGLPVGQLIEPQDMPGAVPAGVELNTQDAVQEALEGNPGLQAQRVAVANAEADVATAKHALLPSLSVTARAGLSGFDPQDGYGKAVEALSTLDFPTVYVGGNFSAPVGNRSAKADLDAKQASLTRAELGLEASEQAIAQQVASLVRTLESARTTVELAELNLRLAEQTLDAEKALQEVGKAIQKDVLEAQRARDAAEVERVRAAVDYRKALVELMALQGRL